MVKKTLTELQAALEDARRDVDAAYNDIARAAAVAAAAAAYRVSAAADADAAAADADAAAAERAADAAAARRAAWAPAKAAPAGALPPPATYRAAAAAYRVSAAAAERAADAVERAALAAHAVSDHAAHALILSSIAAARAASETRTQEPMDTPGPAPHHPDTYRTVRIALAAEPGMALTEGDTLYLARVTEGVAIYTEGSVTPWRTNQSDEEIIEGWCGSADGVNVHAIGRGVVVRSPSRSGYSNDGREHGYVTARVRFEREGEVLPPSFIPDGQGNLKRAR